MAEEAGGCIECRECERRCDAKAINLTQRDGTRLWIPSGSFPDYRKDVPAWIKPDTPVGVNDYNPKSYGWVEPAQFYRWVREQGNWMFMLESGSPSPPDGGAPSSRGLADARRAIGDRGRRGLERGEGLHQRLGIARVMLHDPSLILLDEPYTGLDANAKQFLLHVMVALEVMAVVVLALLTVCAVAGEELLPLKLVSPAYVAVRLFTPADVKVIEQFPAATVPVQLCDPSETVTLPEGVPAPGEVTATL